MRRIRYGGDGDPTIPLPVGSIIIIIMDVVGTCSDDNKIIVRTMGVKLIVISSSGPIGGDQTIPLPVDGIIIIIIIMDVAGTCNDNNKIIVRTMGVIVIVILTSTGSGFVGSVPVELL